LKDLGILKISLDLFQKKIAYQLQQTEKMRKIKEILNYLLKEIDMYQSKKKLLQGEIGVSPTNKNEFQVYFSNYQFFSHKY